MVRRRTSRQPALVEQAVILAAGKGERLHPLTTLRPKVMLPIGNKPILQHVVEALVACSIKEVVIVVGYHKEQVQDYFGSGERFGVHIRYATQEHQLGTGHALLCAQELAQDRFLVLPGDNIVTEVTIQELVCATRDTVLVTEAPGTQYGAVMVQNGLVQGLLEKPREPVSPWVNTGAYLLHGTIFEHLPEELELPGAVDRMIREGGQVAPQRTQATWWDAVHPWDLLRLNGLALAETQEKLQGTREPGVVIKGAVSLAETSVLRANSYIVGPVVIGEGCEIGPSVSVYPYTSIGNNVVIDSFTQLRNCILGNSIQIGSHGHLSSTIVADGCTLGPHLATPCGSVTVPGDPEPVTASVGSIIADNTEIGASVALRPGLLVGPGARIREMNQVREDVPAGSVVV